MSRIRLHILVEASHTYYGHTQQSHVHVIRELFLWSLLLLCLSNLPACKMSEPPPPAYDPGYAQQQQQPPPPQGKYCCKAVESISASGL